MELLKRTCAGPAQPPRLIMQASKRYRGAAYHRAAIRRPERQERVKGGKLRWPQVQNQHCYKDSEYAIGERAQSLGVALCSTGINYFPRIEPDSVGTSARR